MDAGYARWSRALRRIPLPTTGPLISVVMPVFDPPADLLAAAIASVLRQTYADWELCIADDGSADTQVTAVLRAAPDADPRIRVVTLDRNAGIAAASNAALGLAQGGFIALLDHDDELAPHALARLASEIAGHPEAELIFSDEDKLEAGRRCSPYFKPRWNPDLMLGQNAVNHLAAYRHARLIELGGWRSGFEGSQDYELALRVAAACGAAAIRHIPDTLYHWRQLPGSYSAANRANAQAAARRAVTAHVPADAIVQADPVLPQWNRVVYPVPRLHPLVSIVVAHGPAPSDPEYGSAEILLGTAAEMARAAHGSVLLLLAPGLRAVTSGWLRELASQALRPEIGAAGARLDWPDGRIGQSGLVLDEQHIAQTLSPGSDCDDPGYFGQFRLARTVSAVSRDCLAIRRDVFLEAGGLDPAAGPYADVDLCLRLAERGLRCVWTPYARLGYTERPRMMRDPEAARLMRSRWRGVLAHDPYFNPNLRVRHGKLALVRRPDAMPAPNRSSRVSVR